MKITASQLAATRAIVSWYFKTHHGSQHDVGLPLMFMSSRLVGEFAITKEEFESGDSRGLFRMLVACSMFQRLRDQLVLKILQNMPSRYAREIADAERLQLLARDSSCAHVKTTLALREHCDLTKDESGQGCCSYDVRCHLKEHTVAMKRYGHFGKVPTSIAHAIAESGADNLADLYADVRKSDGSERARSIQLETALSRAWRVSQKIASMFLSLVSNPDLARPAVAPWSDDIDWTYFVVVDSNVDLFLASINYKGGKSYDDRRAFLLELARHIKLNEFDSGVREYNPRLVQQAIFLFMSASNRKAAPSDCTNEVRAVCARCPGTLKKRCPVRQSQPAS